MDEDVPHRKFSKLFTLFFPKKNDAFQFPNDEWAQDFSDFFQTEVGQVMVPRSQMVTVEHNLSLRAALETVKESGFSRIPVQKEKKDNIIGILHAKDIFFSLDRLDSPVESIMRKQLFIHSDAKIYQALEFFRTNKIHFAVVVDEYGGVDGIVTVEDIIEELFGDFQDEFDKEETPTITKRDDDSYILDADQPLEEFNERFATVFEKDGIETLGGYICDKLGKIGELGDVYETGSHEFEVLENSPRQILKVKYTQHKR